MPKGSKSNGPMLPLAPRSIQKGSCLSDLLDKAAIDCLAHNLSLVHPQLDASGFKRACKKGLAPLSLMQRGHHLAGVMNEFLPESYEKAVSVVLGSLTPPMDATHEFGLAGFFYLPHISWVGRFGWDASLHGGRDPFEASMKAQYEITKRFTAEFSMRHFLIHHQKRTIERLILWTSDSDPHVRRLCSEGSRPRLPWAVRIPELIKNPRPALPILERLKDDPDLYVRRSVANHLADIAKDHPKLAFEICRSWLKGASKERKWMIRHALRYPAKKGVKEALALRKLAA